jgi:hypothetical protein
MSDPQTGDALAVIETPKGGPEQILLQSEP